MNKIQEKLKYDILIKRNLQQLLDKELRFLFKVGRELLLEKEQKINKQRGQGIDPSQLPISGKCKLRELAEIEREMIRRNI